MRYPRRLLAIAPLAIALVASGCEDGPVEASSLPPFEPVSRAVETEAGVLVVRYDNIAASLSRAVRLDAETLEVLDGEVPMHQGGPLDPTGRWIAVMDPTQGGLNQRSGVLVHDLDTWELAWTVSDLPRGTLQWHETGLYLWGDSCERMADRGACAVPWTRGIWRLGPAGAEELVRFDFSPLGEAPTVAADGATAYAVGVRSDTCCGIAPEGDAFLAVLDLETGVEEARVLLPGLLAGQPGHWLGSTEHRGGRYVPGLAVSPDGSRAYVVHAETDSVTVIDLDAHEVIETHSLQEGASPTARLGGWLLGRFARTAEAKGAAEYLRKVQLTPDGRYLLISGTTTEERPEDVAPGTYVEPRPAGLLVVDALTMEVVYRDETSESFALSPNGYSVLAWGRITSLAPRVGLTALDLRTLDASILFPDQRVGHVFVSPDGQSAYVRVPRLGQAGDLLRIDLETGEVLAEQTLEQRGEMDWDWPAGLHFSP